MYPVTGNIFILVGIIQGVTLCTKSLETILYECTATVITQRCSIIGTRLLVWSSEKYIGAGQNNFEFGLFNTQGLAIVSPEFNTTTAVLLNVDDINNLLESELTFMVSRNGTIRCLDDSGNVHLNIMVIVKSQERCKELNSTHKPDTTTKGGAIAILSAYTGYIFSVLLHLLTRIGLNIDTINQY